MNFGQAIAQEEISLGYENLDDENVEPLIKVIKKSSLLRSLELDYNFLTLADGKLTDAVSKSTIIVLNLSNNNISTEGAKHLARTLKENDTVETLYLRENPIGNEGVMALADALKHNTKLIRLSLNKVRICSEGAEGLADMLVVNESMKLLDLSQNNITDGGAESFADALMVNKTLETIHLYGNKISGEGMEKIVQALRYNITIDVLRLGGAIDRTIDTVLRQPRLQRAQEMILLLRRDIAVNVDMLKEKDELLALLKADKVRELAEHEVLISKKDKQLATVKAQLQTIINVPIDLTGDDSEPESKRIRTGGTPSSLAIMHEQNQKIVQVKQEKNAAEATLRKVIGEKESVEANLEETREDLAESNELSGQLALTTNIWQGRFDELASLVQAGGQVDGAMIADIRNRSMAGGT